MGSLRFIRGTITASIKLFSGFKVRLDPLGEEVNSVVVEENIIYLLAVRIPIVANRTIKMISMAREMNPPVAVVYSVYPL